MKLHCRCGEIIYEGGNPQPDKAEFISSPALSDFLQSLKGRSQVHVREFLRVIGGDILQCSVCGRLYIQDRERDSYHCFVPESDLVPKNLFARKSAEA